MTATPSFVRRAFPRVRVSFDVDVRVEHAGKARTVAGRVVVLGAGGAFLELDAVYPIGSFMHVRFELPTLGEIACRAIVRNAIEDTGVGVEFLDIEGVEHRRIVAFVTKHQAPTPVHYPPPAAGRPAGAARAGQLGEPPTRAGEKVLTAMTETGYKRPSPQAIAKQAALPEAEVRGQLVELANIGFVQRRGDGPDGEQRWRIRSRGRDYLQRKA